MEDFKLAACATPPQDYRSRIYARYATCFKDAGAVFDATAAARWGSSYDVYLKSWIPDEKSAPIADIACGAGSLLFFFKSRGYTNVSGVDLSLEQVALARQVVEDVVHGDVVTFLRSRPGSFQVLTALDLIEHLNKNELLSFLDACHDALAPGGRLILQTPNGESPMVGQVRYGDLTHETCFTADSLSRLMRLCGFDDFETRETHPVVHGPVSMVRWCLWQLLRARIAFFNAVETGSPGSRIFTRVFLASAVKKMGHRAAAPVAIEGTL